MPPHYRSLTRAEVSLAQWHHVWRNVMFGAALGLMALSWFALHWLLVLVGVPDPFATVGALVIEVGMAGTATTATTIRKPNGRYYLSLWAIFSFLMLLAQGANVGHAVIAVSERLDEFPPDLNPLAIYIFAGAFAALFPLGGTLFIHVSGFLRIHGADAHWVDEDAQQVVAGAAQPARKPATQRARTAQQGAQGSAQPDARTDEGERAPSAGAPVPTPSASVPSARTAPSAPEPALTAEQAALPARDRARLVYDAMRAQGVEQPVATHVAKAAGITKEDVHPATVRRWVNEQFPREPAPEAASAPESNGSTTVTTEELERLLDDAEPVRG